MSARSPERQCSISAGSIQCTEPAGHEKAHAAYRDGRLVMSWLTPEEFQAAKDRGEFDRDPCRCDDPIPVCEDCGGEIL